MDCSDKVTIAPIGPNAGAIARGFANSDVYVVLSSESTEKKKEQEKEQEKEKAEGEESEDLTELEEDPPLIQHLVVGAPALHVLALFDGDLKKIVDSTDQDAVSFATRSNLQSYTIIRRLGQTHDLLFLNDTAHEHLTSPQEFVKHQKDFVTKVDKGDPKGGVTPVSGFDDLVQTVQRMESAMGGHDRNLTGHTFVLQLNSGDLRLGCIMPTVPNNCLYEAVIKVPVFDPYDMRCTTVLTGDNFTASDIKGVRSVIPGFFISLYPLYAVHVSLSGQGEDDDFNLLSRYAACLSLQKFESKRFTVQEDVVNKLKTMKEQFYERVRSVKVYSNPHVAQPVVLTLSPDPVTNVTNREGIMAKSDDLKDTKQRPRNKCVPLTETTGGAGKRKAQKPVADKSTPQKKTPRTAHKSPASVPTSESEELIIEENDEEEKEEAEIKPRKGQGAKRGSGRQPSLKKHNPLKNALDHPVLGVDNI